MAAATSNAQNSYSNNIIDTIIAKIKSIFSSNKYKNSQYVSPKYYDDEEYQRQKAKAMAERLINQAKNQYYPH